MDIAIEGRPLSVMLASIEVNHEGCVVQELSKRLDQNLTLWLPNESTHDGSICAYFRIQELMNHHDFDALFHGLDPKVHNATMYLDSSEQFTTFKIEFIDHPVHELLKKDGVGVDSYTAHPDKELLSLRMVSLDPYNEILRNIAIYQDMRISELKKGSLERGSPRQILTDTEKKILNLLTERGFFSLPTREVTLKQIAQELEISDSKLSLDVRRISNKLFTEYLNETVKRSIF